MGSVILCAAIWASALSYVLAFVALRRGMRPVPPRAVLRPAVVTRPPRLASVQAAGLAAAQAAADTAAQHARTRDVTRELLDLVLASLAALLLLDVPFVRLLLFATVLDLVTTPWEAGRYVGLARLPGRVYREWGKRVATNAVILLAFISIANTLPLVFGLLTEVSVTYAATRAAGAALGHVLPAGHPIRLFWEVTMRRVERLWTAEEPAAKPDETPPGPSPEVQP